MINLKSKLNKNIVRAYNFAHFQKMSEHPRISEKERLRQYLDETFPKAIGRKYKRKNAPGPDQPDVKKQVISSDRLRYEGKNEEEKLLVQQINDRMVNIEDKCADFSGEFPFSVAYKMFGDLGFLDFKTAKMTIRNYNKPKLEILDMKPRQYTWEELSAMLYHVFDAERVKTLESLQQQIEKWFVKISTVQTACNTINTQIDRLGGINHGRIPVQFCQFLDFHCRLDFKHANFNGIKSEKNYVRFAELFVKFLEMFERSEEI